MSAESWFLMLAIDLVLSVTNPFTNYRRNRKLYYIFVLTISLATAWILVQDDDRYGELCLSVSLCVMLFIYIYFSLIFFFLIQHQLGISSINICWSKDNGTKNMNVAAWILFYIPLFVFYTIAFVVLGKKII